MPTEDPVAYIEKHGVTAMLHGAVNDLAREAPADPISFLINSLLKAAAERGQEPSLMVRLRSIQTTLQEEQKTAVAMQEENAVLKRRIAELEKGGGGGGAAAGKPKPAVPAASTAQAEENEKLQYRIKHLLRALDELEQKYEGGGR